MSQRHTILIAEDDANIRLGLRDSLETAGYGVILAEDGRRALSLFKQHEAEVDLAIIDIMMPEVSGFDLCKVIRQRDSRIPILMLTAKSEEVDRVVGLELGADDYIVKPFSLRELQARIAAAYRRSYWSQGLESQASLPASLDLGAGVAVDRRHFCLMRGQEPGGRLTAREMKLLEALWAAEGGVLSRNELLDRVWGIDYIGSTRTLDQHVAQVRKKLEAAGAELIETVHGVGYRLPR